MVDAALQDTFSCSPPPTQPAATVARLQQRAGTFTGLVITRAFYYNNQWLCGRYNKYYHSSLTINNDGSWQMSIRQTNALMDLEDEPKFLPLFCDVNQRQHGHIYNIFERQEKIIRYNGTEFVETVDDPVFAQSCNCGNGIESCNVLRYSGPGSVDFNGVSRIFFRAHLPRSQKCDQSLRYGWNNTVECNDDSKTFHAVLAAVDQPSCFDGKQSWFETGVDCGGACNATCVPSSNEQLIPTGTLIEYEAPNILPNPRSPYQKSLFLTSPGNTEGGHYKLPGNATLKLSHPFTTTSEYSFAMDIAFDLSSVQPAYGYRYALFSPSNATVFYMGGRSAPYETSPLQICSILLGCNIGYSEYRVRHNQFVRIVWVVSKIQNRVEQYVNGVMVANYTALYPDYYTASVIDSLALKTNQSITILKPQSRLLDTDVALVNAMVARVGFVDRPLTPLEIAYMRGPFAPMSQDSFKPVPPPPATRPPIATPAPSGASYSLAPACPKPRTGRGVCDTQLGADITCQAACTIHECPGSFAVNDLSPLEPFSCAQIVGDPTPSCMLNTRDSCDSAWAYKETNCNCNITIDIGFGYPQFAYALRIYDRGDQIQIQTIEVFSETSREWELAFNIDWPAKVFSRNHLFIELQFLDVYPTRRARFTMFSRSYFEEIDAVVMLGFEPAVAPTIHTPFPTPFPTPGPSPTPAPTPPTGAPCDSYVTCRQCSNAAITTPSECHWCAQDATVGQCQAASSTCATNYTIDVMPGQMCPTRPPTPQPTLAPSPAPTPFPTPPPFTFPPTPAPTPYDPTPISACEVCVNDPPTVGTVDWCNCCFLRCPGMMGDCAANDYCQPSGTCLDDATLTPYWCATYAPTPAPTPRTPRPMATAAPPTVAPTPRPTPLTQSTTTTTQAPTPVGATDPTTTPKGTFSTSSVVAPTSTTVSSTTVGETTVESTSSQSTQSSSSTTTDGSSSSSTLPTSIDIPSSSTTNEGMISAAAEIAPFTLSVILLLIIVLII